MSKINLSHVLFIGPLLFLISESKTKTPDYMYNLLFVLLAYMVLNVKFQNLKLTYYNFIKAMHYFIWIPLLLYVGFYKNKSNKLVYPIFKLIALSTTSYHLYYFVKKLL